MAGPARECFICADFRQGFSPIKCQCGLDENWIGSPDTDPATGTCVEHVCLNCGTVARMS